MRSVLIGIALAGMVTSDVRAEEPAETPVESRIVSLGLFKNGLAAVTRRVEVPGPGVYRLDHVPEPVHGTFWVESDATIDVRVTTREIETPVRAGLSMDLQEDLAGREVVLHLRGEDIPPAVGRVVRIEAADPEDAWDRSYHPPQRYYPWLSQPAPAGKSYLVLETADGCTYVEPSMIACAQVRGGTATVRERRPVMLLDVRTAEKPATVLITTLAKGMAWAPSYRVDISDPKTLVLQQKAVIKNELHDIRDAEISLISGFPSVAFAHVTSPLSLRSTWAAFFGELNREIRPGQGLSRAMTQQAVLSNVAVPDTGLDLSAIPMGEGPDMHYQPIGRRSLAIGDALALQVGSGTAGYERIVEWLVPDTRTADGRYVREHERDQNPEKYQDTAWDAVRFRNPLPFPMTTGPAMVVGNGRFHGQRMSFWANTGEETTLHVTKALSLRTRSAEYEEQGERQIVYVGGDDYRKTTAKGELWVSNHRKEAVKLVIRRRFSGELLQADGNPDCRLREEGIWSVNKRNELTWALTLEPGAEKTLTYRYTVLVNT